MRTSQLDSSVFHHPLSYSSRWPLATLCTFLPNRLESPSPKAQNTSTVAVTTTVNVIFNIIIIIYTLFYFTPLILIIGPSCCHNFDVDRCRGLTISSFELRLTIEEVQLVLDYRARKQAAMELDPSPSVPSPFVSCWPHSMTHLVDISCVQYKFRSNQRGIKRVLYASPMTPPLQ